jgi:hypothetical protein
MTKKCPHCKNYQAVDILQETKAEETLDGLGHLHVICKMCSGQFNVWMADKEAVKKVYGDNYDIYQ